MTRRRATILLATLLAGAAGRPARADDISDLEGLLSEQVVSSASVSVPLVWTLR